MGWRATAEALRRTENTRHDRHDRHNSPAPSPIVPIVPIVPASPVRLVADNTPDWRSLGADPESLYFVLDDDDGWIGECPRQTHERLARERKR